MAKHRFILHFHDLGVILLVTDHDFLLSHLVLDSFDLHLRLLKFKLVRASQRELFIKLLLKGNFPISAHLTDNVDVFDHFIHFKFILMVDISLLVKLFLQDGDLALELSDNDVILITFCSFL